MAGNNTTTGTGHSYTLDATAPSETFPTVTLTSDTGSSGTDFITSNGGVHFAGTVADTGGAGIGTVQVFNGATLLGTASVSAGNWSLDTILAAGTYNALKVTVTDLAGNSNTTTNAQTIIVDATAPSETFPTVTLTSDTGSSGTDFITSNGGVHFAGTVADTGGAGIGTVQVFNGATLLGTASVSAGNWSLDTILAAGTYNALKVTVTDLAGNSNTTTNAQTIIVDATAPSAVATVTALSADTGSSGTDFITSVASQTVSGTFTGVLGAGEKIQVSADGGTTWVDATPSGSNWSASGVTLSAGTHTLSVHTIDTADNTTAGTGHSYTLAPPSVVITTIVTPNGYDMHGMYGDIAGSSGSAPGATHDATHFDAINAGTGHTFHLVGTGYPDGVDNITGGTVTEIDILNTANGAMLVTMTGFAIDAVALNNAVGALRQQRSEPAQRHLQPVFLRGDGRPGNDTLLSFANADMFDGGGGLNTVDYIHYGSGITADLADPSQNTGNAAGDSLQQHQLPSSAPITTTR